MLFLFLSVCTQWASYWPILCKRPNAVFIPVCILNVSELLAHNDCKRPNAVFIPVCMYTVGELLAHTL